MKKKLTIMLLLLTLVVTGCSNLTISSITTQGTTTTTTTQPTTVTTTTTQGTTTTTTTTTQPITTTTTTTQTTTTQRVPVYDSEGWDQDRVNYINPNPILKDIEDNIAKIDYSELSASEKLEIYGLLEEYLMQNNIAGISLMGSATYAKINDRIYIPSAKDYYGNHINIPGYGYGIIEEGYFIDNSSNGYYRLAEKEVQLAFGDFNWLATDNYTYLSLISQSYFSKKLNETKNGVDWYPSLATNANVVDGEFRPLPLDSFGNVINNATDNTYASSYRVYVKTGQEAKYFTATNNSNLISYNGQEISIEDYLTPYKKYFNEFNYPNVGSSQNQLLNIKGMQEYIQSNSKSWDEVGIKIGKDNNGDYLDFSFIDDFKPFEVLQMISNPLFSPIPESYLNKIGGIQNYMNIEELVDTSLCVGPYTVDESSNADKLVLNRNKDVNENIIGGQDRYNFDGIKVLIYSGYDYESTFHLYNEGDLDFSFIPNSLINQEKEKPNTHLYEVTGKQDLNMNVCDEETWISLFGENGSVTQTDIKDYWDLKPAMSNNNFVKGIQLAINRKEIAESKGYYPLLSTFLDNIIYDNIHLLTYNRTDVHYQNLLDLYVSDDIIKNYGYDVLEARKYFALAAEELLSKGYYYEGDIIEIELCWMTYSQLESYGEKIKKYLEDAFNHASVCNNNLTLEIKNTYTSQWTDIYYRKIMVGQYDICIGGINGNNLIDSRLEIYKSDNSSGYTLNWGINSQTIDKLISYDGKEFSYDDLCDAVNTGIYVNEENREAELFDAVLVSSILNEDNSRTITIKFNEAKLDGNPMGSIVNINLYSFSTDSTYSNIYYNVQDDGTIIITLDSNTVLENVGNLRFDISYNYNQEKNKIVKKIIVENNLLP